MAVKGRLVLAAAVALLAALGFLLSTPSARAGVKAALFVPQVVPAFPVKPLEWFTAEPVVERVSFPREDGTLVADLYRPGGTGRHPGVLFFLGVAPAGPEDPRIVNLGKTLARLDVVTMFYWSAAKMQRRIDPADVGHLVTAFQGLRSRPEVDQGRVGMGGFCVGAAFVLMAASREEIRHEVAFVNAFGPYFQMRDLVRAIASGTRFWRGETSPWSVDRLTREVFELMLVEEAGRLPGEGAADRLLRGVPVEEVDWYLEQLPPETLRRMDLVSPRSYLDGLRAPILVMHDGADNLVPADESRRLVEALEGRVPVAYTEFSLFRHMDPTRPVAPLVFLSEIWKLFRHLYQVMLLVV